MTTIDELDQRDLDRILQWRTMLISSGIPNEQATIMAAALMVTEHLQRLRGGLESIEERLSS